METKRRKPIGMDLFFSTGGGRDERGKRFLTLLLFLCLVSCSGFCATYTVALDGSGDYARIQSAIAAARDGDEIVVRPGMYEENIEFLGYDIVLTSEDPEDWAIVEQTVIKAAVSQPVVTFSGGETSACRLEGFTVQDGFSDTYGGGIFGQLTQATIRRCVIKNNTALIAGGGLKNFHGLVESCRIMGNISAYGGAAAGCNAAFINCLVADNQATDGGLAFNNCDGVITLCTVANNTGAGSAVAWDCDGPINNCIFWDNQAVPFVDSSAPSHCCFPDSNGSGGNLYQDPQFVFPGDYHLRSGSPCVDAGTEDPPSGMPGTDLYGQDRLADGTGLGEPIVDMGACEFDPAGPLMIVTPQSVTFRAVVGQTVVQSADLWIANAGGGQFDWTIGDLPAWLTAEPESGTAVAGQDPNIITLTADAAGLESGRYACTLIVNAPEALNSTLPISVEMAVFTYDPIRVPQIFSTIQEAIDAAVDGSRIVVADGVYTGPYNRDLDFCGKQIVLESENGPENCIIDCQQLGRGFYFHNGEEEDSVVEGFSIRNGYAFSFNGGGGMLIKNSSPRIVNCRIVQNVSIDFQEGSGGGIELSNSMSQITGCTFSENRAYRGGAIHIDSDWGFNGNPIIKNCIVNGNTASQGAGIFVIGSGVQISFCTIVENRNSDSIFFTLGAGIYGSSGLIKNTILWANGNGSEEAQIYDRNGNITVDYSCVQGWTGDLGGDGNIGLVPKFVKPGYWIIESTFVPVDPIWIEGDYHLQSEGWRWDWAAGRWTYDEVTSPCIDAGNPADELGDELPVVPIDPTGIFGANLRVDMGAYGQTDQASLALPDQILLTDMTNDGTTDLEDLLILADRWLRQNYQPFYKARGADFTRDNIVNLPDLACLAGEWLKTKPIKDPLAHWTFDDNWLDTMGNFAGVPAGGALISHSFYKVGMGSAYFDGVDDQVTMQGFKGVSGQTDRTVCFWMNTTGVNQALVGWGSYEDYAKWAILTSEDGKILLRLQGGNVTSAPAVSNGLWHHVAVVLNTDGAGADTADITMYLDGQKVSTTVNACPIDTEEYYDMTVGWFEDENYYHGFIDDLRIYDTALNPWQIADIFYGEE